MMQKPDAWTAPKYDKSFGPMGQWSALRKLRGGEELTEKDAEWLEQTSLSEVDGDMVRELSEWKAHNCPKAVAKLSERKITPAIYTLFEDIESEIASIKNGDLPEKRASEIAKFRTMQLRGMELLIQAGNLEMKLRDVRQSDERTT